MWLWITIALIIVLIISCMFIYSRYKARYVNFISGMWVGEQSFLNDAELDNFSLFIKDEKQGYLIMVANGGEVIANYPVKIKMTLNNVVTPSLAKKNDMCTGTISIRKDDETSEDKDELAAVDKITISMLNGTMTLYSNKKLYAFLEKDIASSTLGLSI